MRKKITAKSIWTVLKNAFQGFSDDKVTKLSGALAYFTVFSMGPMLVVIISLCGIFLGQDAIEGKVYDTLRGTVGIDTATTLQEIIKNAGLGDKSKIAAVIGIVTLMIGATSVFGEIQDSINTIWGLKPKPKRGWVKMLQNRFLSFSILISLAFILLVSLAVSGMIEGLSGRLQRAYPDVTVAVFYGIDLLLTLIVTTFIFGVIFKVLPDASIKWRDVLTGAVVTAILFMIGKFGIGLYINKTDVGSTYGTAGSLVILLLWVYYSSMILYFGAEFTKAYAVEFGSPIHPSHYAVTVQQVEVETGGASIQHKEATVDRVIKEDEIPVVRQDTVIGGKKDESGK
jgi:membrane protein